MKNLALPPVLTGIMGVGPVGVKAAGQPHPTRRRVAYSPGSSLKQNP